MFKYQEGFWYSKLEPNFPKPCRGLFTNKKERDIFLNNLEEVELHARIIIYKGPSNCRICNNLNGCATYHFEYKNIRYEWPDGFKHYIEKHKVKPTKQFIDMIIEVGKIPPGKEREDISDDFFCFYLFLSIISILFLPSFFRIMDRLFMDRLFLL